MSQRLEKVNKLKYKILLRRRVIPWQDSPKHGVNPFWGSVRVGTEASQRVLQQTVEHWNSTATFHVPHHRDIRIMRFIERYMKERSILLVLFIAQN